MDRAPTWGKKEFSDHRGKYIGLTPFQGHFPEKEDMAKTGATFGHLFQSALIGERLMAVR